MRLSFAAVLTLMVIISAVLLPIGKVVEMVYYPLHNGLQFGTIIEISIPRLDFISRSFPGIESVFILWIFVASLQALNLLAFSSRKISPIIAWLVFLSAFLAQLYIPSLVLDLALPVAFLASRTCEPNIICSWPAALGLVIISFEYLLKDRGDQWPRIGYG